MNRIFPEEEDYDDYCLLEYALIDILEMRPDLWDYFSNLPDPPSLYEYNPDEEEEDTDQDYF
jgi:hypothetical protein